ncbi:MAG TPA: hypothetical protein VF952_12630 [Chloroflexia bacterium]
MAERTVRPTNKTLRSVGLLPREMPHHLIASGKIVPGQPEPVSQVFGPAEVQGDRTSIRVASVRYVGGPDIEGRPGEDGAPLRSRSIAQRSMRSQVAVIEVDAGGVRIRAMQGKVPLLLAGILLAAWNIYWIVRALREWDAGTR